MTVFDVVIEFLSEVDILPLKDAEGAAETDLASKARCQQASRRIFGRGPCHLTDRRVLGGCVTKRPAHVRSVTSFWWSLVTE